MDDINIEIEFNYNPWTADNEERIHALTQTECDSTSHTTQQNVGLHDSSSPASMKKNY
jgi:hypothetical protein